MFGKVVRNIGLIFEREMEVMYIFQLIEFLVDIDVFRMYKVNVLFIFIF